MTFGYRQIRGASLGRPLPRGCASLQYSQLPLWATKLLDLCFFEHYNHLLELLIAVAYYHTLWPWTFARAATPSWDWVLATFAFNFLVMLCTFGAWHAFVFHGPWAAVLRPFKFNPEHPYAGPEGARALRREVLFTSAGFAQSAALQCLCTWLLASGRAPMRADFWATPLASLAALLGVNLWRTTHFYFVHRLMHPWGWGGAWDVGKWLYKRVHSLHHKSANPGPWSGLSMHPVEHLLYYSCVWPCMLLPLHPLVFLFAKFHADVSPVGGHDGHADPGGGGAGYHWLHHHRFEVNYGVPTIDWDRFFGSFVDTEAWRASGGDMEKARALTRRWDAARGWGRPLSVEEKEKVRGA